MKYVKCLLKAILAGFAISFGGMLFLKVSIATSSTVLAAFLFSFGLILICNFDFYLYTGKICYLFDKKEEKYFSRIVNLIIILIGNLLGTLFFSFLMRVTSTEPNLFILMEKVKAVVENKIDTPWYSMIGLGFFCGILVYLAVEGFKKIENNFGKYVVLILAIGGFIICGFEHSIANMFYYFLSGSYSLVAFGSLMLCVLGNTIGGLFIPLINKIIELGNKGE